MQHKKKIKKKVKMHSREDPFSKYFKKKGEDAHKFTVLLVNIGDRKCLKL
jgi:hypothetical protein